MKQAQLQTMQTIFILIIVFFLGSLIVIFLVSNQQYSQNNRELQKMIMLDIKKTQIVDYLPELKCSQNTNYALDCFDKYAIKSFLENYESNQLYYTGLLGFMKIIIIEYDTNNSTETVVYNHELENYETKRVYSLGISILDPIERKIKPGVLHVEIFR